jgi:hypothetical protein
VRRSTTSASVDQLAASGLGWEDIAALLRIKGASERAKLREAYFIVHRVLPPPQQNVGFRLPGNVRGLRGRK